MPKRHQPRRTAAWAHYDHHTPQRQADIRQFRKRLGLASGVIWWGVAGCLFLVLCVLSAAVA